MKDLTALCESRGTRLEPRATTDVGSLAEAEVTDITKIDGTSIRDRCIDNRPGPWQARKTEDNLRGELGLQTPDRGNGGDRGDKHEPPKKKERK